MEVKDNNSSGRAAKGKGWRLKSALCMALALALVLSVLAGLIKVVGITEAGNTHTYNSVQYKVTSSTKKTVQAVKMTDKTKTSVSIPATVKVGTKSYKVTAVGANFAKANTKLKKVTIGKNVAKIGKKAFYNCKNLKTVAIKTRKLTSKNVGANAFKGLNAKAAVTVPTEKLTTYKKILKAKGLTGKNQTVKADGNGGSSSDDGKNENGELIFDKDHPLPEPENVGFSIGDYSNIKNAAATIDVRPVVDTAKYTFGDTIPFTAGIRPAPEIYGTWGEKHGSGFFVQCGPCGMMFSDEIMFAIHYSMSSSCAGGNYIFGTRESYTESYYNQDDSPCKVVCRFTLPQGLSYKNDSIKLTRSAETDDGDSTYIKVIDSGSYHTEIIGNEIVVTIDNIKSKPFYVPFNEAEYKKNPYVYTSSKDEYFRNPIIISFETEMNGSVATDNAAASSITYYYKDAQKTINFGGRSIDPSPLA